MIEKTALANRASKRAPDLARIRHALNMPGTMGEKYAASLPFAPGDVSAGSENELQTCVIGKRDAVDLPLEITGASYYRNIMRRAGTGDSPKRLLAGLEKYLADSEVWDNSYVRFSPDILSPFAASVLNQDFQADKSRPDSGERSDADRFRITSDKGNLLRVPASYILKIALADMIGTARNDASQREQDAALLAHYLNDNTSPEVTSFYPVSNAGGGGIGTALAEESLRRCLLTQCAVQYANRHFGMMESGQCLMVYFAPQTSVRQQDLNSIVSDSFYRQLFMNPCLSGWDRGEYKLEYMGLCHRALSRSRLNTLAKLRSAGILVNNLVTLPNTSNTSLANNGTHVSIGSSKLGAALADGSGFKPEDEKYLADLVIKITEHFLPLFEGTYSAAPGRVDFSDFHPENVLGFLPHELDYTHLRMMWRRWKKKARNNFFGYSMLPWGPTLLDNIRAKLLRLKGDFVPDVRMIDYLVSPLSTHECPAFSGIIGNDTLLLKDLAELGIFDAQMSIYHLYRARVHAKMGFSGFEGRYYSLSPSLLKDFAPAVDLQALITALAYHYVLRGEITHADIPDDPDVESERRQIVFAVAAGVPTAYVRNDTRNMFIRRIMALAGKTRSSGRYSGYTRIETQEYQLALLRLIERDAPELVAHAGAQKIIEDLKIRLDPGSGESALDRLTKGILAGAGARSPFALDAREFNTAAEQYYRSTLRKEYMEEAWTVLEKDCAVLCPENTGFLSGFKAAFINETGSVEDLRRLTVIIMDAVRHDAARHYSRKD